MSASSAFTADFSDFCNLWCDPKFMPNDNPNKARAQLPSIITDNAASNPKLPAAFVLQLQLCAHINSLPYDKKKKARDVWGPGIS